MSWFKGILDSFSGESKAESGNASPEEKAAEEMKAKAKENSQRMEEERKKRDEKEKTADDLKLVIDGAKLECKLCTSPQGLLKVNFDTPSIQNKKTATVMEKDMKSLIFTGTCKKSPNSSSPCASVMQLGDWKDTGTLKVQDQYPLLLKSTIPCLYGGVDIKITDCGQRNEPADLDKAGAPVPKNDELDFDIKIKTLKDESTFLPLGLADFKGKAENGLLRFQITITGKGVNQWQLDIKDDDGIVYTVFSATIELKEVVITTKTKSSTLSPVTQEEKGPKRFWPAGEYSIVWDGFDNNGIYQNTRFLKAGLSASITGVADSKMKTDQIEEIKFKRSEVNWVDVKIDKTSKRIDVTLRVNLKDGGAKGLPGEEIPKDILDSYKFLPIKERTKSFEELNQLALDGVIKHWGRNSKSELVVGKNVAINNVEYEVYVSPVNTEKDSMDDLDLIFNTNNSWMRSGNPGSVKDPMTAVGNLISREAVCYNVGYIKYSNGWGYQNGGNEDLIMKDTAAHEIGHEILKKYGGTIYSYGHKGSVNPVFQYKYADAPEFPLTGEIDLMPYFSDNILGGEGKQANYFQRRVAAEKDVLGLIWLTKLNIL